MDIEELIENVSVLEVLEHYGANTWSSSRRSSGWSAINCPFCGDTNGSASVNPQEGRFNCHQCAEPRDGRSGGIIDIVKSQEGLGTAEAIQFIQREFL